MVTLERMVRTGAAQSQATRFDATRSHGAPLDASRSQAAPLDATRSQTAWRQAARLAAVQREQVTAAQARLRWGAQWVSSLRAGSDLGHDLASSARPEELARSELFYASTCCWV